MLEGLSNVNGSVLKSSRKSSGFLGNVSLQSPRSDVDDTNNTWI